MTNASDEHGRDLSTSADAAAWYREAQRSARRPEDPRPPLRAAVSADPTFAIAVVDLDALDGAQTTSPVTRPATTWERHHHEIVTAVTSGHLPRAVALLREHLHEVGCDPLAVRIVEDHATDDCDLEDLATALPSCHSPIEVS
jgi:hypothetical protein